MNNLKLIFNSKLFWIIIIFLSASIFRLFSLDLIEFKSDEAITVYQTVLFYNQPHIIERGLISGIGVYNFPVFNYLIVFLSVFSRDPLFLSFLIALINSILVIVFYLIIRKYYNQQTAIFSSLILAFSPWAIIFSRKIWAQDLIFLFLIPLIGLIHELIFNKNKKVSFWILFLLILLTELHGSGLYFFITTIIIFLIYRVRLDYKSAILGIFIGLIPIIPYIFFQINANPICPDCESFFKYQNSIRNFDIYNFIRPLQIMGGLGYHFVLGNDYNNFINAFPIVEKLKYIFLAELIIPILGTYYILTKKRVYIFIPLYIIIMPLLYFLTRTNPYMHYFVILVPFLALLYGISFNFLFNLSSKIFAKVGIIILFLVILTADIIFLLSFNNFLSIKKNIDGDYGPIFSYTQQIIENEIKQYSNLPYYFELQSFAYVYQKSADFHYKLALFFLKRGNVDLWEIEIKKDDNTKAGLNNTR